MLLPLRYDTANAATEPAKTSTPADSALPTYVTVVVSAIAANRTLSSNTSLLRRRLSPEITCPATPSRSQVVGVHARPARTSPMAPSLLKVLVVATDVSAIGVVRRSLV